MVAPNRTSSVIERVKQIEAGDAVITRFVPQIDDEVKLYRRRTEANFRIAGEILAKVNEKHGEPRARDLIRSYGLAERLAHVKAEHLPALIRAADEFLP